MGSEAVWKFSENSSILANPGVPKVGVKKASLKIRNILENAFLGDNTPKYQKMCLKSEKKVFCYFVQFLLKRFKQNTIHLKVKVTFSP